jgi:hypothetical protein
MRKEKIGVYLLIVSLLMIPTFAGAALLNPGFEEGLNHWNPAGTVSAPVQAFIEGTEFTPYEGNVMAALSDPTVGGNIWDNSIHQDVIIGSDDNFLNFVFIFWTLDEAPFDNPGFLMEINGKTILSMRAGDISNGAGNLAYTQGPLDGWTGISIPVSQYYSSSGRAASIRISFNAGNTGDSLNPSGVFIDAPLDSDDSFTLAPIPGFKIVPIPGSVLLLGSGLGGILLLRNRFQKRSG